MGSIIAKTAFYSVLGLLAFVGLSFLWDWFIAGLANLFGLPPDWAPGLTWVVLLAVILLPKKYLRIPFPMTLRSEVLIQAPIDKVWRVIDVFPRTDYFRPSFSEIRAVSGKSDHFELVFEKTVIEGTKAENALTIQIVKRAAPNYLAYFHDNKEDAADYGVGSSSSEFLLTETEDGTLVCAKEVVSNYGLMFFVTLAIVNPMKDMLAGLAAHCEDRPDTSWAARTVTDIKDNDGSGLKTNVNVIGITACVVVTLIALGLVYALMKLASI